MTDYHEDATCGACGGPLEVDRDAICHKCASPEQYTIDTLQTLVVSLGAENADLLKRVREVVEGKPVIREPIPDFAAAMEAKLKTTDHKGGRKAWLDIHECTREEKIAYFNGRILDEFEELMLAETAEEMMGEAIDIANFALMVWDNAQLVATGKPVCPTCGGTKVITCDDYPCTNPEKCAWGEVCKDGKFPCPDCGEEKK